MQKSSWLVFLARLVYGIILPGCLLYLAMVSHFNLVRERQILKFQEKMTDSLDRLTNFHDDDRFFHGLLQSNFRVAARSSQPRQALAKRIAAFHRKFPGMLKFIVWDNKGALIPGLSDEKRFQYVIKSMYQAIIAIFAHISSASGEISETLPGVSSRITLLRGYFGQFLMEKHMVLPMLDGYLGSCIRGSEEREKGLLWYQIFPDFGLICMVHQNMMNRDAGSRLLIDGHNSKNKKIRLGYFDTQDLSVYGVDDDRYYANDFIVEANAYFNSAVEFRRSKDFLLLFRQVSPRLIVFSRMKIQGNLLDADHEVMLTMFALLKWLLVLIFVGYSLSLHSRKLSFSVRQKLLLLFLFANGLPLMILGATGYEFFEQKKNSLINEEHDNSSRIIKDFDNLYPAGRDVNAKYLRELISKNNKIYGEKIWPPEKILELRDFIDRLNPSESYLFNGSGEQLLCVGREALTSSVKFIRDFFKGALEFFNNSEANFDPKTKTMIESFSDEASVYYGVLNQLSRIGQQNYGSGMRWTYLDLLGAREKFKSWGILLVSWRSGEFQKAFLRDQLEVINAKIAPHQLIVMEKGSEIIFPPRLMHEKEVRKIMHRTQSRKLVTENNLMIGGKAYIATSLTGVELSEAIIMAVYPRDLTLQVIDRLLNRVLLAAIMSILVVVVIVRFFSGRLLAPISSLSQGVRAIARRDFKFRADFVSEDEFGQLIKVFNETLEGMQELAIGTAVQESLLPPGRFKLASSTLFARSIFMSKMGGDYYDYFQLDEQRIGVFFGDVAGHGIPAALVMAMAKAVIATARSEFSGPSDMLTRVNSVFLHLKEKGWRRMMTGLCLELNCASGEFCLANAGQCYPVIVGSDRAEVKYVKAVGMPLGNTSRKPYAEIRGQLQPGDTLFLYTDGIIEATNAAGDVFDFSRFEKLLLSSWSPDLETYWSGIFKGYSAWAPAQDDDITFLMVKYERE